jgi:hypothetical protein
MATATQISVFISESEKHFNDIDGHLDLAGNIKKESKSGIKTSVTKLQ